MLEYLKTKVIKMSKENNVETLFDKLLDNPDERKIMKVVINNREPEKMLKELLGLGE
jgi:hypothetical protein